MPTGTLPAEGKKIWEKVHDKALKTTCKERSDPEECAAKIAWSAVKGAGWKKDGNGKWHKADLTEFSLAITRASYDKVTNQMRWRAVASDTDEDSYGDKMSLNLFSKFIERIKTKEQPPEMFRSDFWAGGLPYLSVSHYPDLNGEGVPGAVEDIYIDGNRLKATGIFEDTPLGRACFKSVCDDLYNKEKSDFEDKVRISIAFLDYAHKHKSNGNQFERKTLEDICPYCLEEFIKGEINGKEFLDGHLIHLAMTRVPVNKRTDMEVERSMTTMKEDAASIAGEDEAEELDNKYNALLAGKSEALVIKSDEVVVEEAKHMDEDECKDEDGKVDEDCMKRMKAKKEKKADLVEANAAKSLETDKAYVGEVEVINLPAQPSTYRPFGGATSLKDVKAVIDAQNEKMRIGDLWYALQSVIENISEDEGIENKAKAISVAVEEFKDMMADKSARIYNSMTTLSIVTKEEPVVHPLDEAVSILKSKYDALVAENTDEKFQEVKAGYEAIGKEIMKALEPKDGGKKDEVIAQPDLVTALSEAMKPLMQEVGLLRAQLADSKPRTGSVIPERRSISPSVFAQTQTHQKSETPKLQELVRRSVGIQ